MTPLLLGSFAVVAGSVLWFAIRALRKAFPDTEKWSESPPEIDDPLVSDHLLTSVIVQSLDDPGGDAHVPHHSHHDDMPPNETHDF